MLKSTLFWIDQNSPQTSLPSLVVDPISSWLRNACMSTLSHAYSPDLPFTHRMALAWLFCLPESNSPAALIFSHCWVLRLMRRSILSSSAVPSNAVARPTAKTVENFILGGYGVGRKPKRMNKRSEGHFQTGFLHAYIPNVCYLSPSLGAILTPHL